MIQLVPPSLVQPLNWSAVSKVPCMTLGHLETASEVTAEELPPAVGPLQAIRPPLELMGLLLVLVARPVVAVDCLCVAMFPPLASVPNAS
jgi:hypothetical protein